MIFRWILMAVAFKAAGAFGANVRFLKNETPVELGRLIHAAVASDREKLYFDHDLRVLHIRGPLIIDLPVLRASRRGLFLRNLHRVLGGERFSATDWALWTKNADVTIRDAFLNPIEYAFEPNVHLLQPKPASTALVEQIFRFLPGANAKYDLAAKTLRLRGTLIIDLSAFEPNVQRSYRSHLDLIFDGDRRYDAFLVDAGSAAIVHVPEVNDDPPPVPMIQHHHPARLRFGRTIEDSVDRNLRTLERWLDAHYVRGHRLLLEVDDAELNDAERAAFWPLWTEALKRGRLPGGFLLPRSLIQLIPAGLSTAQALICQNRLDRP